MGEQIVTAKGCKMSEDNSKKKDNRIELLRFIFAGLLMIFHGHLVNGVSHPIPKGHVFVEFFFFLTGYFTYAHVRNHCIGRGGYLADGYVFKYTLCKIGKLLPYMVTTALGYYFLVLVFQVKLTGAGAVADIVKTFTGAPFDLMLLQVTGICVNSQFNAWWYLSALLFVLPLVMIIFLGGGGIMPYFAGSCIWPHF